MATYKGIQGYSVQKLSDDPTASEAEGQLWYNSATGKFKIGTAGAGAWAAGDNLNTARQSLAGCGTQSAGLAVSGYAGSEPGFIGSEEYNGSAWVAGGNVNTATYNIQVFGIQTSAVKNSGQGGTVVEEYDGTSWTIVNPIPAQTINGSSAGILTAGLVFGGYPAYAEAYEYDGTNWTDAGDLNTGRYGIAGAGTQTTGLAMSGIVGPGPTSNTTEEYNGSSWAEANDLNTARYYMMGVGSQTAAMGASGYNHTTVVTNCETYDGTSYTAVAANATARMKCNTAAGTTTAGLIFGGAEPASSNATEEWVDPVYSIKTVTVS